MVVVQKLKFPSHGFFTARFSLVIASSQFGVAKWEIVQLSQIAKLFANGEQIDSFE